MSTPNSRGRPRDPDVEARIAEAVSGLLASEGYAATTIEKVARRSGIGRPTIYRRYTDRHAMVVSVVEQLIERHGPPPDHLEDPEANVLNHLNSTVALLVGSPIGPIFRAVLSELPNHPELAALVGQLGQSRRRRLQAAVRHAVAAQVLRPGSELEPAIDALVGAIYFRFLMTGRPLDERYVRALLATIKL